MLTSTDDPHYIYSDKISLININMTRIDLATDNDIKFGLVNWAKLFMAETWEELKMLAEKNKTIERAVSSAWQMTEEEIIRERMRNREEGEQLWRSMEKQLEEYKKQSAKYQEQSAKYQEQSAKYQEQSLKYQEQSAIYQRQAAEDKKRADEAEKRLLELQAKLAALEK